MTNVEKFNEQTIGEEIGNAVTHGVGAVFSILGTAFLIVWSVFVSNVWGVVSSCIFGGSLIILYTMSTLYHSLTNIKAKKVFQVFDHCSIFILILGTYTPFCLVQLRGFIGWALWGFNAVLTVLGVVFNSISVKKWHKVSLIVYLLMGWSIVMAIKPAMEVITLPAFIFLLAGGIFYTVGVIFYKAKSPRFMHMIWHLLVLLGSICHYFWVLFYVLPIR